uniref:Glycoside hydrolase family 5 domain-containing protein n=1 Tax=Panagrolaimus superbus TaxID=310955 RepID=A0A914Z488_9BILA
MTCQVDHIKEWELFTLVSLDGQQQEHQQRQGKNPPYGQLGISGKYLISAGTGSPVQLHGMSLFWSQWMPQYYNKTTVNALKCSWNTNVIRAAMAVEEKGYLENKERELQKIYAVIDAAIEAGIYVVVDWHDHNAQNHKNDSIEFFTKISKKYGNYPNIIYETFNEPLKVSWSDLKPYHEAVIAAIRTYDKNNVIIVGTPYWSQFVDEAANNPITNFKNIAYSLHYYSGSHKQDLRNRAITAIYKNIALFVTEYGTVNDDGNGGVDQNESELWWNFLDQNKISYINWSISDKDEGASALKPGTTASQIGNSTKWTTSGIFVRNKYISQNNGVSH